MQDLNELNPYPEDEPRLRRAWEDGYKTRAGGGRSFETVEDPGPRMQAWLEGYQAAKQADSEDSGEEESAGERGPPRTE